MRHIPLKTGTVSRQSILNDYNNQIKNNFQELTDTVNNLPVPATNLTLTELQAIQFTDAPAPTGVTITPDAVGANPVTMTYKYAYAINSPFERSLFSEVTILVGASTTGFTISGINIPSWADCFIIGFTPAYGTMTEDGVLLFSSFTPRWSTPLKIITNQFPIGQQYYVTDKNWLLYVDQPTVLKPVKGSLHIFNGETLPEGIEPDVLFIDTGIVDWDTSDNPVNIQYDDYAPVSIFVKNYSDTYTISGLSMQLDNSEVLLILNIPELKEVFANFPNNSADVASQLFLNQNYSLKCNNPTPEIKYRCVIHYVRVNLTVPIPVPHIVSAEMSLFGDEIYLISDCLCQDGNFTSDLTLKINGIAIPWNILINSGEMTLVTQDLSIVYGDVVTFSIASGNIKNTWGGLLEEVIDYPVVNNVPA